MKNRTWWENVIKIEASIDDGAKFDKKLAKLFIDAGIPTTVYLPVDYVGISYIKGYPPLSEQNLRWIEDNCEIGSHTVSHPYLTRIPLEQARQEIVDSKNMLEARHGRKITSFCYPRGYANADIIKLVKDAGYTTARNTLVGNLYKPEDPLWTPTTVHLGVNRNEYGGLDWLEYACKMFDKAKELADRSEIIYHIWGHGWEIEKHNQWHKVEELIKVLRG